MTDKQSQDNDIQTTEGTSSCTNVCNDVPAPIPNVSSATGNHMLSEKEKEVLAQTSRIRSNVFPPFADADLQEQFWYPFPFTDQDGFLELSPKQKEHSPVWTRIGEISKYQNQIPKIVHGDCVDWMSIRQSLVGDCSFLSSLVVASYYEKRFKKPLITSMIYPKDVNNVPVYNPSGKYLVKLHLNGIARRVIIDDYLPIKRNQNSYAMLCAHSSNHTEFWVSLLEKAYMKLLGGYDFPGSEGGRDLHALTGWIPEMFLLQDKNINSASLFDQLKNGLSKGRCLITVDVNTEHSEEELKRVGLVGHHAYAVLDLREVDGVKVMQLKNPWSQERWKGKYSEFDEIIWTRKSRELLGYDPKNVARTDNGVFWIDYNSVLFYFHGMSVNWNPHLFQFSHVIHEKWIPDNGIVANTVGNSPQYLLTVEPATGSVWVLLTTHVTSFEDISQKREFVRLQAYLNNGRKVLFPSEYFLIFGEKRINNQHFLAKLRLDPNEQKKYTLVLTQYNKTVTNFYTIRIYCGVSFELKPLPREHFANVKKLTKDVRNFLKF